MPTRRAYIGALSGLLPVTAGCLENGDPKISLEAVEIFFQLASAPEKDYRVEIQKDGTRKYRNTISVPSGQEYFEKHRIAKRWMDQPANYAVTVAVVDGGSYTVQSSELVQEKPNPEDLECGLLEVSVLGTDTGRFEPWLRTRSACLSGTKSD